MMLILRCGKYYCDLETAGVFVCAYVTFKVLFFVFFKNDGTGKFARI